MLYMVLIIYIYIVSITKNSINICACLSIRDLIWCLLFVIWFVFTYNCARNTQNVDTAILEVSRLCLIYMISINARRAIAQTKHSFLQTLPKYVIAYARLIAIYMHFYVTGFQKIKSEKFENVLRCVASDNIPSYSAVTPNEHRTLYILNHKMPSAS